MSRSRVAWRARRRSSNRAQQRGVRADYAGEMHHASEGPALVRLIRSEITWIAAACVVALLAHSARAGIAVLVVALVASQVLRVRRVRALRAAVTAANDQLAAAVADRDAAEHE